MARARNIKPGFFKNEVLGVADPLYSLLFEGLWVLADRSGRLEDRPLRIKAEVFPYRDADVGPMLDWLQENEFIVRYSAGGKRYIEVLNFSKHQNPHKNESESDIPSPSEHGATSEEIGSPPESTRPTRADSLSTDSLSTDSLKEPAALSVSDLKAEGVSEEAASEWFKVRKKKRAIPLSPLAWSGFKAEVQRAGWSLDDAVRKCAQRNWISFEAAWVQDERSARAPPNKQEALEQRGRSVVDKWVGAA